MKRNRSTTLLSLLFVIFHTISAKAQLVPSADENIDFLMTFGKSAQNQWGDDDYSQVHFFIIPKEEKSPVYIRIFDPETGGMHDTPNNGYNTTCNYRLFGGKGAYSNPAAKETDPVPTYDSGKLIKNKSFGRDLTYDNKWFSFGPINPSEGEYSEEFQAYVFKLICTGESGDDGNAYRYSLSYNSSTNTPVNNSNVFTYEMSFKLKSDEGAVAHIYPFITDDIESISQFNFDADNDVYMRVTSIGRKLVPSSVSMDGKWATTKYKILAAEKRTSMDIQLIKKSKMVNDMVINIKNQYNQAIPLFSSPIGGKPRYLYDVKLRIK